MSDVMKDAAASLRAALQELERRRGEIDAQASKIVDAIRALDAESEAVKKIAAAVSSTVQADAPRKHSYPASRRPSKLPGSLPAGQRELPEHFPGQIQRDALGVLYRNPSLQLSLKQVAARAKHRSPAVWDALKVGVREGVVAKTGSRESARYQWVGKKTIATPPSAASVVIKPGEGVVREGRVSL